MTFETKGQVLLFVCKSVIWKDSSTSWKKPQINISITKSWNNYDGYFANVSIRKKAHKIALLFGQFLFQNQIRLQKELAASREPGNHLKRHLGQLRFLISLVSEGVSFIVKRCFCFLSSKLHCICDSDDVINIFLLFWWNSLTMFCCCCCYYSCLVFFNFCLCICLF